MLPHINTSAVCNIFSYWNLELLDMAAVMGDNFALYTLPIVHRQAGICTGRM
jgi:hypothetical protein